MGPSTRSGWTITDKIGKLSHLTSPEQFLSAQSKIKHLHHSAKVIMDSSTEGAQRIHSPTTQPTMVQLTVTVKVINDMYSRPTAGEYAGSFIVLKPLASIG